MAYLRTGLEMTQVFERFLQTLPTKVTSKSYEFSIHKVLGADPNAFLLQSKQAKERIIEDFILSMRDKVSNHTVSNYLKGVKSFTTYAEETDINWKKLQKLIPKFSKVSNDRAPTVEELQALLKVCDIRDQAIVLSLCSSGMRLGGICGLKLEDYEKIDTEDKKTIGKLSVYHGELEQYETFISAEAVKAVDAYLAFRRKSGESLTDSSPLFRLAFNFQKDASNIKPLNEPALAQILITRWRKSGIRTKDKKVRRKGFKSIHGMRKFFKTQLENAGMNTVLIEKLLGHFTPYYKPTKQEMQDKYLAFMQSLAITPEFRLTADLKAVNQRELASLARHAKLSYPDFKEAIDEALQANQNSTPEQFEVILNKTLEAAQYKQRTASVQILAKEIGTSRLEIPRSELSKYLGLGYKPIFQLADGKLVIEKS